MTIATTTTTEAAVDVDTFDYKGLGTKIATAVYDTKNTFRQCQLAWTASTSGASHESIAKATAEALKRLSGDSKKSFSRQAVDQRVIAYGFVEASGVTPVAEVVAKAYTLAQKSTATEELKAVAAAWKGQATGDDKADAKALAELLAEGISRANAVKKAKAVTKAGDETTDEEREEGQAVVAEVFVDAAEVAAFIRAQAARTWSEADAELIRTAIADLSAAL